MSKVTQYSRISHHTIAGSASAGLTFSVPAQEDFTDGSWTPYDLALSEIGVNEQDEKVFIRIDDTIKEFAFIGASGVGFTGGSGNCITDLYLTNMYGCSPITIHDNFIQKDGTSVNSEDSNLQITFDNLGQGAFTVQKINGTSTQLEILEIGRGGVAIQTIATNSNVQGVILCQDTTSLGIEINIILESASAIESSRMQLGPSSSLWQQTDNTFYDNRIDLNTTDMLFKADDFSNIKYAELQLTHTLAYFSHSNNGLLSYIQAQDDTILIQTQNGVVLNIIEVDGANGEINISTDVSGVVSQINMNVNDITIDTTNYINQETLNGSKIILKGTQQYINTVQDYRTTNDNTPIVFGAVVYPDFTPVTLTGTTSCWLEAEVLGFGATNSKAYGAKLFGTFKRSGGTVTQVSTTNKVEQTDFATTTSDFNITGNQIYVEVTGEAGTDIDWNLSLRYKIQTQN
jgi:hypothetical protein